jgi:hypothetical protein
MLKQYQDLLANVRQDGFYHSIRSLIQPNDPEIAEVADVLIQYNDFVALSQDMLNDFYLYTPEAGDFWNYPWEILHDKAGDCITGDTPIWVRVNGEISLLEVRELLPRGDYGVYGGIEIFTPSGFAPLNSITRKGVRPTFRLLSTSAVGITPEHKIIVNQNLHGFDRYQTVENANFDQLIRLYPELPIRLCCNYETAWAYGLFFADGSAGLGTRGNGGFWRIVNANRDYLKRAAMAFTRIFPEFYFTIDSFDSYKRFFPTNLGPRRKKLYCLNAHLVVYNCQGLKDTLIKKFRSDFYNTFAMKKVPNFVLKGDTEVASGFWDGVHAGDGEQDGDRVTCKNKIGTMGLSMVLHKIGKTAFVTPDHAAARIWGHKEIRESKNWRIDGNQQEVFDVSTGNGEFVAGDLAIKNCDCRSILLCSILRNFIPPENVFCAFGYMDPNDKESGHMWVIVIQKDGHERVVEATAPSTKVLTGKYEPLALFNDVYTLATDLAIKDFDLKVVPLGVTEPSTAANV